MTHATTETERSIFEQHAQTALTLVIVGLLGWAGIKLNELGESVAKMTGRVETLQSEVQYLRKQAEDRYTSQQAERDQQNLQRQIDAIYQRLRKLEGMQ